MNTATAMNAAKSCCHHQSHAEPEQAKAAVRYVAIGGGFSLTDHHGNTVTQDNYKGRLTLIFFGFTHCRQVCPRALSRISEALDLLRDEASHLHALYISVDPERDTPPVMKDFLSRYPRITGLTGSLEQIESVKQKFKVFAKRAEDEDADDGYVVPHTALTYLLGPDGAYLSHFNDAMTAHELATRLHVHISHLQYA
ncbi:SCO family protein [Undibacterium terreum]|uniref:Electron transporter SenC n=1 Tax=Undibacterium terreum TaxID=1224302 RepID=A0A916U767_9BURK|nr:SCO family protein [Undibacterium terreum]GGC60528.1 electron transporter SenC [Undibacterium terreum]